MTAVAPPSARDDMKRRQNRALLALFAGAVGISLSPIFVRISSVEPTVSAFYRTALAVPLLLAMPLFVPRRLKNNMPSMMPQGGIVAAMLVLAGVFFALDLFFWHRSIALTSVANATLLPNMAPILVTLAAWLFLREKISGIFVIGLVIAFAGSVILVGDSLGRGDSHFYGDMLGVVAAFFYAGYLLVVSRLRRHFPVGLMMLWSSLVSAIVLLALLLLEGNMLLPPDLHSLMVLFALAAVSQVGGQGLIAYALAHLPVSFSSVGLLIQPALAALFGYVLLAEPLSAWQAVGMVIILCGIYLARRGS